jgi:hypothetical protein
MAYTVDPYDPDTEDEVDLTIEAIPPWFMLIPVLASLVLWWILAFIAPAA